ncbi:MAG TPA: TonB-dependent receptor plug domain-containing protein [Gemmatimonadaceae bacterium]|nr:TonB-dependent receptor plug domain-containing protein [Gemmatimonadaceae bacterium]
MTASFSRSAFTPLTLGFVAFVAACGGSRASRPAPASPTTVTSQDLERNPGSESIETVLQAKSPGVLVTRTSDGIAIQIRGPSSFSGNTQPLFVIDDVPMEAGPGGALRGINPYDIESIKVLKDPAETGIYGMRGANGVILIKMKKPGRAKP